MSLTTKSLTWYCHVAHEASWTKSISGIAVGRGRPRKSWSECVKVDVDVCNLEAIDSQNWRSGLQMTSQQQLTTGFGKLSAVWPASFKQIKPGPIFHRFAKSMYLEEHILQSHNVMSKKKDIIRNATDRT